MDNSPVGVFDSGLGGISVLREAVKLLPAENYIYYGDNKNAPYGSLSEADIARYSFDCADFLVKKGVKAILLACNTATGTCIRQIRERLSIPVVSIEPAIKPACLTPGSGKILMLATPATTKLERYLKLQASMPDPRRVINVPCASLVGLIEQGIFEPAEYQDMLHSFLSPYCALQIDGIVLGCTHFLFIKEAIAQYAKTHLRGECSFFDGNAATVLQLGRVLKENGLENTEGNASVEFYTSGDKKRILPLFSMLMER